MRHDREMWDVLLECDLAILRLFLHGALWRGLRRMEAREAVRARATQGWERRSISPTKIFLFFFFHYYHHDKKTGLP